MPSKEQDVAPSISPVLFMTVEGLPMSFYLRPGPVKQKLQPLITAGGGLVCNIQQPGAILLINPEDAISVSGSTAQRYVSTQYIYDCIEKEEQLNIEDYKVNCDVVQRQSPRLNSNKDGSSTFLGGRLAYTPEEDSAILNYVSKRTSETGGNRIWKEMEKQRVTAHSWQSMKDRYQVRLTKKEPKAVEVETKKGNSKTAPENSEAEANQQIDAQKPSSEEVDTPHADSAESDLTQLDVQLIPAGGTPENVDLQTSIPLNEDVNQQPDESSQQEAEMSCSPQAEQPFPDTSPGDSPLPQLESTPTSTSSKKQKKKQKASGAMKQPARRMTRRQLEMQQSPEPYGKKLRSSSSSHTPSPQSSKRQKSVGKSALQKDTATDSPPPKRARGKFTAAEESQPEQRGQDADSTTDEPNPAQQKVVKAKEKRPLGILELATREFESNSDEDSDLQDNPETVVRSAPTPPPLDSAADPPSEAGPGPQGNVQTSQTSSDGCVPDTGSAGPSAVEPVRAASKPHLFIFDSESQEEASQRVAAESSTAPSNQQPDVNGGTALSLTQLQLEEDKQRIRELINQTGQDLDSVTKALLRTSGDFSAALDLLLNPSAVSLPFWNRHDDSLLLSADSAARQQLQEKYGEENVAKRLMFLDAKL
ncbi:unnamed protein product [Menidia menidia]|uniref:Telomeric repeat-binding factor 2-interacting protein 1 n=1 Tax=Menidia menidia TaxID=238744 RepID=A0A8S4BJR7_9TELE|nr:unnamed protein product [Menidia menidia]